MATKTRPSQAVVPGRFYKPQDLAELTGIPERTIRSMMDDGRLAYHLIGEERGRVVEGQDFLDWKRSARRINGR